MTANLHSYIGKTIFIEWADCSMIARGVLTCEHDKYILTCNIDRHETQVILDPEEITEVFELPSLPPINRG